MSALAVPSLVLMVPVMASGSGLEVLMVNWPLSVPLAGTSKEVSDMLMVGGCSGCGSGLTASTFLTVILMVCLFPGTQLTKEDSLISNCLSSVLSVSASTETCMSAVVAPAGHIYSAMRLLCNLCLP